MFKIAYNVMFVYLVPKLKLKNIKMKKAKIGNQIDEKELARQCAINVVSNRTLNTFKSIDADTNSMVNRVSQKGYIMNERDNQEMRMRIEALKSVLYGC